VATLTRIFGLQHLDLAEDIVQDTLLTALNHWSVGNIPDNPGAWITQVAKRKVLNELERSKTVNKYRASLNADDFSRTLDEIFLDKEIQDSQLRMMFTCCHPSLSTESQIALTLKTLCGFGVHEVAKALLTTESTINKRLYRAKQQVRENKIDFDVPVGPELDSRLKNVNLTLYLLFNEGYNSSDDKTIIRKELCLEAMRLTQLLVDHFNNKKESKALLSLMCLHTARFDARIDKKGGIIIFEDQDRSKWSKELITTGIKLLHESASGESFSEYHLEAGIAAEHCMADSYTKTNWKSIYYQYELLYAIKNNPIIKLNLAIIKSQSEGIDISLKNLQQVEASGELDGYYLLPVTQGVFLMKVNQYKKAINYLNKAKTLTDSKIEIDFINDKLMACHNQL